MAPRRWQVLAVLCTGVFLAAIDFNIVSVAVPDMLHSFPHARITGISWVINGYTVTFTAALLPAGGLADRYGHRRVFLCGLAVFTSSALACAVAPSAPALVAARLVEGFGGGTVTPLALPLILPRFPAERRGAAIGLWTATQSVAVAAGPSIGGGLVSALGWRSVFFLQLPIGLAALVGTGWALGGEPSAEKAGGRLPDLAGVGLLVGAIGMFSLAVVESKTWGPLTWRTDITLAVGLGLGAVIVRRTLHHPAPIVDLGLLKIGTVRRANVAMLVAGLVIFAVPLGTVLFLIGVWHYSAARAGLAVTPGPIMQAVAALAAGRVINRFGPRAAALPGAVLLTAGTLIFALGAGSRPEYLAVVLPAISFSSAGLGLCITSLSSVVVSAVSPGQLASGTAMTVTARAIGAVVSLSALALLLAAVRGGTHRPEAYHIAWVAMSVVAASLTVMVATTPGRPRQENPTIIQISEMQ